MMGLSKVRAVSLLHPIIIGVVLAILLQQFFFSNYIVEGSSMTPTLQDGNLLVINKFSYQFDEINRFDVVVFHANEQEDYVKRVIGLPGDEVTYRNGSLFINGSLIEEPYLTGEDGSLELDQLTNDFSLLELTGEKTVPEGQIFVIGDNRIGSYDSRHYGFISIDQVVGKVNLRYYPFQHIDISF